MAMVEVTVKRAHRFGGKRAPGETYLLPEDRVPAHLRQGLIEDPAAPAEVEAVATPTPAAKPPRQRSAKKAG